MRSLSTPEMIELVAAHPLKDYFACEPVSLMASELPKGEKLFFDGDAPKRIYLMLSGAAVLAVHSRSGEKRALCILRAPSAFGELEMLNVLPQTVEVTALETCLFYSVSCEEAEDLAESDAAFLRFLLEAVARRSSVLSERLLRISIGSLRSRLAAFILDSHRAGVYSVTDRFAADYLGASERRVRSIMAEFRNIGALNKQGRTDEISDFEILNGIAEC